MKILFRISLVIVMFFTITGVYAQPSDAVPDKVYGLDPLLHNGKYYTNLLPAGTGGTPFFSGPDFVKGFVVIRGITYDNLLLKYDVFNHQLILLYKTGAGADNQIIISDAWLESFNLGTTHFEMLAAQDTMRQIYQVMGTGPGTDRILYSWRKELALDTRLGATNHEFSDSKKETYLYNGTKLLKYKSNRNFVALFDPAKQVLVKKYLRQQHVKVKKASDWSMTELINYCNTISPK